MASTDRMSPEEKEELILRSLQEVMNPEIIKDVLYKEDRPLKIYWGTATTGKPHCGYFVPMVKLAHFLKAGCHLKVLLADVHGFLDNLKAPIELVKFRAEYYKFVIVAVLEAIGVPVERLEFVLGSSYQLSEKYIMDIFRTSTTVTVHDAQKSGAEVVKQSDNPCLSGLIYPIMQALDEEHLDVDVQFGGVDQRKIFALAVETLGKVGYKRRAHLMNAMVPGLAGGKMSASDPNSKIDLLEKPEVVKKKIKKAVAAPRSLEGNGLISFVEHVLLPVSELRHGEGRFVCETREGTEGTSKSQTFTTIEDLKSDYLEDRVGPQKLKSAVAGAINDLLAPIQSKFQKSTEWQELEKKAYPLRPEPEKKGKKVKNLGTRFPGKQDGKPQPGVVTQPDGHVEGPDADQVNLGIRDGPPPKS